MRFILILFSLISIKLTAQLADDFSDGNFSINPSWEGDTEDFIVNDEFRLQLNASDAGTSFLYTTVDFPDSLRWEMKFKMDFAPSSSNKLRIVLASNNVDLNQADGFVLEIGENGSEDAIQLIQLIQGSPSLIASGTMGAVASDPVFANIKIEKTSDDIWSMNVAYSENDLLELEFEVSSLDNLFPLNGIFGVLCTYTSSRADAFSFDDINIEGLLPDTESPIVTSVNTVDPSTFEVFFNESVDEETASSAANYFIAELGNPVSVTFNALEPNKVVLIFDQALESGQKYNFVVTGVEDLAGNVVSENDFQLCLIESAQIGDLVINEILFDPYPDGADFIEIYNKSNKFIALQDLVLSNDKRTNDFELLQTSFVLEPQQFIAISSDVDFLKEQYQTPEFAQFLEHAIPTFNNTDGNVSISRRINDIEVNIDSFDYVEDLHFELLADTEGVSLERRSYIGDTNDPENWHSAASSVNYATPGYINSNIIGMSMASEEMLSFEHQVFSPNGDGDRDQLVIHYQVPESGFVANIRIYDVAGLLVRNLVQNELLQIEGFYTWDGLNEEKTKYMPVGMYIVQYQFFQTGGSVVEGKKVCVLGDNL